MILIHILINEIFGQKPQNQSLFSDMGLVIQVESVI